MGKSAEKIRPAKTSGKSARKPTARKRKPAAPKQFMLDGEATVIDDVLVITKPSTPARKRKVPAKAEVAKPAITPKSFIPPPRQNAMVVWQKRGPVGQVLHWLRLNGRDFVHLFTNPAPRKAAPAGVKLRTKNELLRELAVLREENAILRKRLGLPQMPFGRQILDMV